jgi:hypothetical protein
MRRISPVAAEAIAAVPQPASVSIQRSFPPVARILLV